jgi:hypothetical protein
MDGEALAAPAAMKHAVPRAAAINFLIVRHHRLPGSDVKEQ